MESIYRHSPEIYLIVKLVGAAYLIYLGYRYLKSASDKPHFDTKFAKQKTLQSIFRESVLVEITNPKTALFFIAFLPQFVSESSAVAPQILVLGLIVILTALPCDLVVAASASKAANWLSRNQSAQKFQKIMSGSILTGIGGFIAVRELKNALNA